MDHGSRCIGEVHGDAVALTVDRDCIHRVLFQNNAVLCHIRRILQILRGVHRQRTKHRVFIDAAVEQCGQDVELVDHDAVFRAICHGAHI